MRAQSRRLSKLFAVFAVIALALGLAFAATGCSSGDGGSEGVSDQAASTDTASAETREFTDSAGRTVEVPVDIERIAPSGHTANQVLLTMAPEKMVGLSQELTEDQQKYLGVDMSDLPVFGAIFGAKGDLNKEAIAAADPQVIIDTGALEDDVASGLDQLQEELGIPCVFIETNMDDYGTAYEMLGDLLGMEERGKELSEYCQNAYEQVVDVMSGIPEEDRANVLYLLGEDGTNVIAKGTQQAEVVDLCADNLAVMDSPSNTGMGSETSLEQIALWNPDIIIFASGSVYSTVADDPAWDGITAIDNGDYYEAPGTPYNWLNSPPTVNQVMGMQWLPRLLYPDRFDDSIQDVTRSYYSLFYGYDLSDEELDALVANALPKA